MRVTQTVCYKHHTYIYGILEEISVLTAALFMIARSKGSVPAVARAPFIVGYPLKQAPVASGKREIWHFQAVHLRLQRSHARLRAGSRAPRDHINIRIRQAIVSPWDRPFYGNSHIYGRAARADCWHLRDAPYIGLFKHNVRSLCLCGLWGPRIFGFSALRLCHAKPKDARLGGWRPRLFGNSSGRGWQAGLRLRAKRSQ